MINKSEYGKFPCKICGAIGLRFKENPCHKCKKKQRINHSPHEEKPDVLSAPTSDALSGKLLGDNVDIHNDRDGRSTEKGQDANPSANVADYRPSPMGSPPVGTDNEEVAPLQDVTQDGENKK